MNHYRTKLPQLNGIVCITDGGMETEMIFNQHINLPEFAAYDLLRSEEGYQTLYSYYQQYAELAQEYNRGLILETPTWRANADWGKKLGDSAEVLKSLNLNAVRLLSHIREQYDSPKTPIVLSGNLGPRGDGYTPGELMSADEAQAYHYPQIATFAATEVDMLCALTLNYPEEAIGIAAAAKEVELPICIAFTVETDGNLPTGQTLEHAIAEVDQASSNYPAYYMINCAHNSHFDRLFRSPQPWHQRVKGLRSNASCLSHAELDEAETLDDGNPIEFGNELSELSSLSSHLSVFGGCCGTDKRHIEQVCKRLHS